MYQYFEKWDRVRGDIEELSLWETFSFTFLDRIFSQELRGAKVEEFVNLK